MKKQPNPKKLSLGERIAAGRRKMEMRKVDLARAAGVSRAYVTLLEGDKREPSITMLNRLTHLFEFPSLAAFLSWEPMASLLYDKDPES